MRAGKNQVDREKRTMFEDWTDMRVRIEQGICNNQFFFTSIVKLVRPWATGTHHKINKHWTIVPDLLNTITTPTTATYSMASRVSPSSPPDWMQHQALMIQNTMSLPRISIDNFTGDTLKWHQWFSFFKATIHNNSGLSDAQKMTYLQNSVTHKARDSISGYSYNGDYYHEAIAELTRKFGFVAAYLDQLEKWPKPRQDELNTFVSFSSFLRRLVQTFRLQNF